MSTPNPFTPAAPFRPAGSALPDTLPDTQAHAADVELTATRTASRFDRQPSLLDRFTTEGRTAIAVRRQELEAMGQHRLRVLAVVNEVREMALRDYGNAILRAQSTALEMEVQRVLLARYEELRETMEGHSRRFHGWLDEAYRALQGTDLPENVVRSRQYEIEAHLSEYHNVMQAVRSRFAELSSARV